MALAIYEGTKKDQLVDEIVDEEILRLLGLEDVSDLDYDDYKTLLRERVAAGRMPGNNIPSGDTQRLTEEFRRVKKETGKLKVKNNKINFNSVVGKATKKSRPTPRPTKRLMGSSVEPEEEVQVQSDGSQDVMKFLTLKVAPSLSKIENSLENILGSLTNQQKLQNKDSEKGRVSGEKGKKKEREEKSENPIFRKLGDGAKRIASPLGSIFESIKKFFMAILGGIISLGLIDLFTNPVKFFRNLVNGVVDFFNGVIESIFNIAINPINGFINTINTSLDNFAKDVNTALNGIDFLDVIPKIEFPQVPLIPLLQIPRIPPPPEPEPKPMKAPGMAGGGKVTTNTGDKISSMGSDTQLVALTPGEVVMSKKAVDAYGADTLLGMNAAAGGTNRPKMGMVPGFSGGGRVGAATFETISGGEGGVNSVNRSVAGDTPGGAKSIFGKNLTEMTVGEIMDAQSRDKVFAVGKYQIIPSTMKGFVSGSDVKKSDKFTEATQDMFRDYIINQKRPEVGRYLRGETDDPTEAGQALAREFASVGLQYAENGNNRGQSRYAGIAGNAASITPEKIIEALKRDRSAPIQSTSSSQSISTPTQSTGETVPYEFSLDDVKPMQSPTSQRPMIGAPGRGGGSSVVVAGGGGAQQQSPSSAGGGAQSSSPMFSPIDQNNPDLLVIKSIYSIV